MGKIPLYSFVALSCALSANAQKAGDKVPDRFVVELRAGASALSVAAAHGSTPDLVFADAFNGFAGNVPAARLAALKQDPDVVSVAEDRIITVTASKTGAQAKPGGSGGGSIPRSPEVLPAGVERVGAIPGIMPFTGRGVGVAVVDTGVDFKHPDLPLSAKSVKVVVSGAKIRLSEGRAAGQDDHGHGTHVGGIVAARLDGYDVVGVAPAATLYAVKVLDQYGSGYDSTVIAGLDWIARNADAVTPPIKVVNMSLARPGHVDDSPGYRSAVKRLRDLGITVVVAAGNDQGSEVSNVVPATYPEVITVASTTARDSADSSGGTVYADTASYFTTDGAYNTSTGIGVSISAPGEEEENFNAGFLQAVGILSTRLGGGTTRSAGTSMAAPHAAGVAALLYEQAGGNLSPEDVRARMRSSASQAGTAPLNSPAGGYTFDGEREGVVDAVGATGGQ